MARKKNIQTFEKRRKEEKRRRKQEEKRQRRFDKNKMKKENAEMGEAGFISPEDGNFSEAQPPENGELGRTENRAGPEIDRIGNNEEE